VKNWREKTSHYSRTSEAEAFERSTGGILDWFLLSAEIACGRTPAVFNVAVQAALSSTNAARSRDYNNVFNLEQNRGTGMDTGDT
jgi:hypothetical protein